MERINDLLTKLDNKVSPSLYKKLEELKNLKTRAGIAKQEYEADPIDANKEALEQIEDYISDVAEDVADDLQDLLNDRVAEKEAKKQNPIPAPVENSIEKEKGEEEEESSFSVLGALGVVAAIGIGVFTLGKLNLFDKK